MAKFDLIVGGELPPVETTDFENGPPDLSLHPHKGVWLPHLEVGLDIPCNSQVQLRVGPVVTLTEESVTYTWSVRDLAGDETSSLRSVRLSSISDQYHQLDETPIQFTMGGGSKYWDADASAITNLTLVALGVATGKLDPTVSRLWTAHGELVATTVVVSELLNLFLAIAQRRDALFTRKKMKEYALSQLEDINDLYTFDPTTGWDGD